MKKILMSILVLSMVLTLSLALIGCDGEHVKIEPKAGLDSWLSHIEDDTPITKIALPGTHDSGTIGMMSSACTQGATIGEQLVLGARYFDIRVNGDKDGGRIFHSIVNGVEFAPIADDILAFLNDHPSEFVVLDFQHFKNDGDKVVYEVIKKNGLLDKAIVNDSNISDLDFVNSLTLGAMRGKAIIFFNNGSEYNKEKNIFPRNNDDCTIGGVALDSLYIGSDHKKGSDHFVEVALPNYMKHIHEKNSGLMVLQGQLTAPNPLKSLYALEEEHSANMNAYVNAMKDNNEDLDVINIIMRDFFDSDKEKALSVLRLNIYKGNVKAESMDVFKTLSEAI